MKIGIFGGTFDPPHIAHLIGAELVREEYHLDRILFIPTYLPPHKRQPEISSHLRLEMLKIAIRDNPFFSLLDYEIERREVSYTIDTIREIMARYKGGSYYLIIGSDQAQEFYEWKEPEALLELLEVIIITRPGYSKGGVGGPLLKKTRFFELNIDISSTMIREKVKAGKSIKYLVPEGVREFIIENKLYL